MSCNISNIMTSCHDDARTSTAPLSPSPSADAMRSGVSFCTGKPAGPRPRRRTSAAQKGWSEYGATGRMRDGLPARVGEDLRQRKAWPRERHARLRDGVGRLQLQAPLHQPRRAAGVSQLPRLSGLPGHAGKVVWLNPAGVAAYILLKMLRSKAVTQEHSRGLEPQTCNTEKHVTAAGAGC